MMNEKDQAMHDAMEKYAREDLARGESGLSASDWHKIFNCYLNHKSLQECARQVSSDVIHAGYWYYAIAVAAARESVRLSEI